MRIVTVEEIMSHGPCQPDYPESRVRELVGEGITPEEIARLDIPKEDILWVLVELMLERDQRLFACDCAERVLPIYEEKYPKDTRLRNAIQVARKYALGDASKEELTAARDAAWDAARAPWDAARATWDAARAAQLEDALKYLMTEAK